MKLWRWRREWLFVLNVKSFSRGIERVFNMFCFKRVSIGVDRSFSKVYVEMFFFVRVYLVFFSFFKF